MAIALGNLSVKGMEARTGVTFPEELVKYLNENKQDRANGVDEGKWHCFDIPFLLLVGDMKTAQMIYDYLQPLTANFKEPMRIGLQ